MGPLKRPRCLEGQAQLRALWARREQLVQMLEAEKKRRQLAT
jgi:hypothetical protein